MRITSLFAAFTALIILASSAGGLNKFLLVIAITFGTINIVGGFLVTDRMLEMFKGHGRGKRAKESADGRPETAEVEKR